MKQKRYHMILDVSSVRATILNDIGALNTFLQHLTGTIGMHVLAGPYIVAGIPQNPGITGIVVIDYSHISVHTFTKTGEALVDIFSCKPYDQNVAIAETIGYFDVPKESVTIQSVSWG